MNSKYATTWPYLWRTHCKTSLIMNDKRCTQKQNKLWKEFSGSSTPQRNCFFFYSWKYMYYKYDFSDRAVNETQPHTLFFWCLALDWFCGKNQFDLLFYHRLVVDLLWFIHCLSISCHFRSSVKSLDAAEWPSLTSTSKSSASLSPVSTWL